jgi:hypothetical protein
VTDLEPGRADAPVFEAMLDGWRAQQLTRNLAFASIEAGARVVRRFQRSYSGARHARVVQAAAAGRLSVIGSWCAGAGGVVA